MGCLRSITKGSVAAVETVRGQGQETRSGQSGATGKEQV